MSHSFPYISVYGPHFYLHICLSLRTITSLTSRMDRLEAELESVKSLRLRHSTHRMPADRGDVTPRYGRKDRQTSMGVDQRRWSGESVNSVASSIFENHHKVPFIWQMPFTVKCIGTFRWAWETSVHQLIHVYSCRSCTSVMHQTSPTRKSGLSHACTTTVYVTCMLWFWQLSLLSLAIHGSHHVLQLSVGCLQLSTQWDGSALSKHSRHWLCVWCVAQCVLCTAVVLCTVGHMASLLIH